LSRIVADLEALASADAAGFTLERRPVRLRELLQEAAQEWVGPLRDAGLRLELDLDDGIVADIDATRIRQVIANLLSNGAKFTHTGGVVGVELEVVDQWAVIRVRDTGCGISADELAAVFDRFYRGRTSRARGSGIGLAIVKQLVEAHGGTVEVSSQADQGTVFTVRLPQATRPLRRSFIASS
jgi:signal transduction histidine kinase